MIFLTLFHFISNLLCVLDAKINYTHFSMKKTHNTQIHCGFISFFSFVVCSLVSLVVFIIMYRDRLTIGAGKYTHGCECVAAAERRKIIV